jgi:hypothetical protein
LRPELPLFAFSTPPSELVCVVPAPQCVPQQAVNPTERTNRLFLARSAPEGSVSPPRDSVLQVRAGVQISQLNDHVTQTGLVRNFIASERSLTVREKKHSQDQGSKGRIRERQKRFPFLCKVTRIWSLQWTGMLLLLAKKGTGTRHTYRIGGGKGEPTHMKRLDEDGS